MPEPDEHDKFSVFESSPESVINLFIRAKPELPFWSQDFILKAASKNNSKP